MKRGYPSRDQIGRGNNSARKFSLVVIPYEARMSGQAGGEIKITIHFFLCWIWS
ncbi:hypothetical protein J7M00_04390 [bacterium]|nr:hypothetical protein [bacterium]